MALFSFLFSGISCCFFPVSDMNNENKERDRLVKQYFNTSETNFAAHRITEKTTQRLPSALSVSRKSSATEIYQSWIQSNVEIVNDCSRNQHDQCNPEY